MSNIQAAIGCAQLERIDCLIKRKKEIFSFYKDFADLTEINLNHELANGSIAPGCQRLYVLESQCKTREVA